MIEQNATIQSDSEWTEAHVGGKFRVGAMSLSRPGQPDQLYWRVDQG